MNVRNPVYLLDVIDNREDDTGAGLFSIKPVFHKESREQIELLKPYVRDFMYYICFGLQFGKALIGQYQYNIILGSLQIKMLYITYFFEVMIFLQFDNETCFYSSLFSFFLKSLWPGKKIAGIVLYFTHHLQRIFRYSSRWLLNNDSNPKRLTDVSVQRMVEDWFWCWNTIHADWWLDLTLTQFSAGNQEKWYNFLNLFVLLPGEIINKCLLLLGNSIYKAVILFSDNK